LLVGIELLIPNRFQRLAHSPGLLKDFTLLVAQLLQPYQMGFELTPVAKKFFIALQLESQFRRR
jgi:hypothetical protein